MPSQPILLYPDPRLKSVCAPIDNVDEAVLAAFEALLDTMAAGPPRTVGIAAPQIGILRRLIAVDCSQNPKHPSRHGRLLLANPVVVASEGTQQFREGCLSIPDYTATISRSLSVVVEGLDPQENRQRVEAEGFEAVVLQHEIDHLNGILFLDRIANVKTDLFRRKAKG